MSDVRKEFSYYDDPEYDYDMYNPANWLEHVTVEQVTDNNENFTLICSGLVLYSPSPLEGSPQTTPTVYEENNNKRKLEDNTPGPVAKKRKAQYAKWEYKDGILVSDEIIENGTLTAEGLHVVKNYIIYKNTKTQIFKRKDADIKNDQEISPSSTLSSTEHKAEQRWLYEDDRSPVPSDVISKSLTQSGSMYAIKFHVVDSNGVKRRVSKDEPLPTTSTVMFAHAQDPNQPPARKKVNTHKRK